MSDVVELRRYALRPGQRDVLIDLFDREFVETQEATGMTVLGQFRDLGDPDQFVWVRTFPNMAARPEALSAFYTGPVWKKHAAAANATMVDSDNVLLLRPARPDLDFRVDRAQRDTPATSLVVARIYDLDAPADDALVEFFGDTVLPLQEEAGAKPLALLVSEYAENNFPALPVHTGVHKVVTFTSHPSQGAFEEYATRMADLAAGDDTVAARLPASVEELQLSPTDRSILR